MATTGLLAVWIWGDDSTVKGALLYTLALPAILLAVLLVPDSRWKSVAASAGGLALGVAVGFAARFDTSDSGEGLRWYGAFIWASFGFVAYVAIGAVLTTLRRLVKRRRAG